MATGDRKAKLTPADEAAARALRKLWDDRADKREVTQDTVAEALDITQGAVSQYLNGKIPLNFRAVMSFAKVLGCEPGEIRRDLPELRLIAGNDVDWSDIRAVRTAAALGDGAEPDDYAETHKLKFRADSLRRKGLRGDRLCVIYGRGDSMLPRIRSGDAILFDTGDTTPRDGALFVVSYDRSGAGGLLAKQLVELGGRWFIQSLNKDDPKGRKPVPIDETKGFEIHGRVRWIGSWED